MLVVIRPVRATRYLRTAKEIERFHSQFFLIHLWLAIPLMLFTEQLQGENGDQDTDCEDNETPSSSPQGSTSSQVSLPVPTSTALLPAQHSSEAHLFPTIEQAVVHANLHPDPRVGKPSVGTPSPRRRAPLGEGSQTLTSFYSESVANARKTVGRLLLISMYTKAQDTRQIIM